MSGHWVEFEREWHETEIVNCSVCGRLIPRRAWVFDGVEAAVTACSRECEELYFSYVVPEYGPSGEGAA